jgi:ABC-type phosphate transport system substrate-binding protein
VRATAKTLLVLGTAIAFTAACTPPLPPDVLAARLERTISCLPGAQEVAVSPDYFEAIEAINVALNGVCPEQTLVPVAIGDSEAKVQILDRPATPADLSQFADQCAGDVLTVPVYGTPIVVAVNILGLDGILLTPQAVAGILNGSITSWNDPIIAEANIGFEIPDIPVDLLRLEGPSGAVEAMTAWLAQQVPDVWTQGQVSTLTLGRPFASYTDIVTEMAGGSFDDFSDEDFTDEENPVVSEDVEFDLDADVEFDSLPGEGTVAIMPVFIPNNNVIPIADLPVDGAPITITNVDLPKVGIAATTLTTDEQGNIVASHAVGGIPVPEQFDIASAKVVLIDGQALAGWPVIALSSIMVCDEPSNPLPLSTAQFFLRSAGQGTFDSVGLTPLPEPIRISAIPALRVKLDSLEGDIDMDVIESPVAETTQ